jgi:hypothetical protein
MIINTKRYEMLLYISRDVSMALLGDRAEGFTGHIGTEPVFTSGCALPNIENALFFCQNNNVLRVEMPGTNNVLKIHTYAFTPEALLEAILRGIQNSIGKVHVVYLYKHSTEGFKVSQ